MHPELEPVFRELNEKVCYAVLRGLQDRSAEEIPAGDIDLLIDKAEIGKVAGVFARCGYSLVSDPAYHPHIFFIKYLPEADGWVKFDVVTRLLFGRTVKYLEIDHSPTLRRRIFTDCAYRLDRTDEFVALLLHCLLDKASIRTDHRARLRELALAVGHSDAGFDVGPRTPFQHLDIQAFIALAREEKWSQLLALRTRVRNWIIAAKPLRSIAAFVSRKMQARLLAPLHRVLYRRGLMVALLAPDGGGKTTLASTLSADMYIRARVHYLGLHRGHGPILQRKVSAQGQGHIFARAINWLAAAMHVWITLGTAVMERSLGKTIVFDRYVYDSYLSAEPRTWAKRLRRKVLTSGWPTPDIVVLLDAPGEVLFARKNEHTPEYLESQRQRFLEAGQKIPNLVRVDATMPPDQVARKVRSIIWDAVSNR